MVKILGWLQEKEEKKNLRLETETWTLKANPSILIFWKSDPEKKIVKVAKSRN